MALLGKGFTSDTLRAPGTTRKNSHLESQLSNKIELPAAWEGVLHYEIGTYGNINFSMFEASLDMADLGYIRLYPISIPIDWSGHNPIAAYIASMEAKKKKALDDYQSTVAAINNQLQRFLAIDNIISDDEAL